MNTAALIRLWNATQRHSGTSGTRRAILVLLGLYNGPRFPFDLTELRAMDTDILRDALLVITEDAQRCQVEVHTWLNRLTGRSDFGERFEHLAHDYRIKGRCKRDQLRPLDPPTLLITEPGQHVPYPEFCRHKDKCAGHSNCQHDPCCAD